MDTHLIVAVHGIGEQQAGQTIDEIVGAATTLHDRHHSDYIHVTVERDVIELAEKPFSSEPRNVELFPVHLRRAMAAEGVKTDGSENKKQAVFAEVFWADKSPAPKGVVWTMFDLLKVVLGLGYLAMENSESNRGPISVGLVHFFTWMFYGFVAPVNAMLLIGCALLLVELTPLWGAYDDSQVPLIILFHAFMTFCVGSYVRAFRTKTYLVRIFANGLIIISGIMATTLSLALASPALHSALCGQSGELGCYVFSLWTAIAVSALAFIAFWFLRFAYSTDDRIRKLTTAALSLSIVLLASFVLALTAFYKEQAWCGETTLTGEIHCYVQYLLRGLGVSWVTVVVLAILIAGVAATDKSRPLFEVREKRTPYDSVTGIRTIFPSICAAMLIFWMVITSSLWLLVRNIASQLRTEIQHDTASAMGHEVVATSLLFEVLDRNIDVVLQTIGVTTSGFLAVVISALLLVGYRKWRKKELYKRAFAGRLILNSGLQSLLLLCLALVAISLYTVTLMADLGQTCPANGHLFGTLCWFQERNPYFTGILLGIGLLLYQFSNYISGGLGIVRDIVVYSTQERCAWLAESDTRKRNFINRVDINNRFKQTLHYALDAYQPSRITVISHSQGTVIATQMLQDPEVHGLLAKLDQPPKITLVTMGSPVTHIYRRYFKEFFQVSTDNMPLTENDPSGVKKAWINIHREDDFVGTRIGDKVNDNNEMVDDAELAQNCSVKAGGHSHYFTDYHVWPLLRDKAKFKLLP
ncbi:MAG: hypothetical protein AAF340_16400 [Pseudomonadota bacterium]